MSNDMHCFRADHETWRDVLNARRAAHAKHGANSIESLPASDPRWLPILMEEVGEVASTLTYDKDAAGLPDELIDVLAVASAWLDSCRGTRPAGLPTNSVGAELDHWQRPEDGWPQDAYFEAVAAALESRGVAVEHWWREEAWEATFCLAEAAYADGPLSWAEIDLHVTWRLNEPTGDEDEPLVSGLEALADDRLPGWYWVPSSAPGGGGDFAKGLELPILAEPEQVAAAVRALVTGEETTR